MFKDERLKKMYLKRDILIEREYNPMVMFYIDNIVHYVKSEGNTAKMIYKNVEPKLLEILDEHDRLRSINPVEDFKYYMMYGKYYINDKNNLTERRVARRTMFIPTEGIDINDVRCYDIHGSEIDIPVCDKYELEFEWIKNGASYPITVRVLKKLGFKKYSHTYKNGYISVDNEFKVYFNGDFIKRIKYAHELELILKALK